MLRRLALESLNRGPSRHTYALPAVCWSRRPFIHAFLRPLLPASRAAGLFNHNFYALVKAALRSGGIMTTQGERSASHSAYALPLSPTMSSSRHVWRAAASGTR